MTDGDEKYKLGELTADMAAVKVDVLEIKVTQKEIIQKLDSINAVSVEVWQNRNAHVDDVFTKHNKRLIALEEDKRLRDASLSKKIADGFESRIVQIAVALIIAGAIYIAVKLGQNDIASLIK